MKTLLLMLSLLMIVVFACKQSVSPTVSDVIDTNAGSRTVITDTKGPDSLPHMDTTLLVVDSAANITLNNVPLERKERNVYNGLYNNWLQAYSESRHLPVALHISYIGTVMMGARGDIMDAVVKAQEDMKKYIARDTYKKSFDSLQPAQQTAMQQQHAILFQKEFR